MEKGPEKINGENEKIKLEALEKIKQQKAAIVNVEELAEAEARKAADAYMTESKKSAKGVGGFFKKIWKHTYAEAFYRGRQVARTKKEMAETGNIYTGRKEIEASAHENAMQAIAERFSSEYEGLLSKGEEKKILDEKDQTATSTRNDVKKLVTDYAMGTIANETEFKAKKNSIVISLKKEELLKGTNAYADNLFEIAKSARVAIEHGAKMEELDFDTNLIIGKAKSSLKTEAKFNLVDRAIDGMKKTKIGRFVTPASVATALGITYCVVISTSRRIASSRAAALATLGGTAAIAGAFAGMNESQRLALERKQHGIEMAEGGTFEEGSKRREQMKRFQYEMKGSVDLENKLRSLMFEKDQDGKEITKNIQQQDLDAILGSLSDVNARRSLNQEKNIDLISYSKPGTVEKERTNLDILVAKTKVELRKMFAGNLKNALPQGKTFDGYLQELTQTSKDALLGGENGIGTQDKAFKKYKAGRVAKKVAMAIGVGLVVGAGIQEIRAALIDSSQGVIEGMLGSENPNAQTQTPLEHIRGWLSGNPSHSGMGNAHEQLIDGHPIKFPEGVEAVKNDDGTFDIVKGDRVISDNIPLHWGANGELDTESLNRLAQDGVIAGATHNIIDTTKEITSDAQGWIDNHPGETVPVARDLWYGNDTPMYQDEAGNWLGADKNELATYWGGLNGSGVNTNGDFEMDISHMTPDGSYQNGLTIDAQEAMKKGTLEAMVSLTEGTQGHPIPVSITTEGKVIFDHNNPLWQQVFKPDANGNMTAHVKFIEIVENKGTVDGVEHIRPLGTYVGEGLDSIKDTIPSHEDIVTNTLNTPLGDEPPYFVPILSRRPLEKVAYKGKDQQKFIDEKGRGAENKVFKIKGPVIEKGQTAQKAETAKKGPVSAELAEISALEYDNLRDDINMLNKNIQESKGIITLEESDFKSEYGKKRYNELKTMGGDKPMTFNKTELQAIGNEMETTLVNSRKEKTFAEKENIGKAEDFLKEGTEFESEYFRYKVLELNSVGNPRVEKIDKETGKKEIVVMTYKKLKEDLEWKGITGLDIKITKIGEKDLSSPLKIKKLKEENDKLREDLRETEATVKRNSNEENEKKVIDLENKIRENEKEQLKLAA